MTVDSAGSIAAGQKLFDLGEKGVGALKRSDRRQERDPAVHRRQDAVPRLRPVGHRRHQEGRRQLRHLRHPAFADGKPASPFIGVNGFYLASKGKNKTLAQEFLTSVVPTADFQSGLYAVDPRRPALTESATAAGRRGSEHPEVRGRRQATARSCRPSRRWARSGARSASPRRRSSGGTDPSTAAHGRRQGDPRRDRQPVADDTARCGRADPRGSHRPHPPAAARQSLLTAPAARPRGDGGGAIR